MRPNTLAAAMLTFASVRGRKMSDCRRTVPASLWSSASNMARFQTFSRYCTARFTKASTTSRVVSSQAVGPAPRRQKPSAASQKVARRYCLVSRSSCSAIPCSPRRSASRTCQCTPSPSSPATDSWRAKPLGGLASFVGDARRCLRQRKALAHQRLRDLPQTLRVPWVERVGLDAVQGAGSVVHRGDVTVLEIETATPVELRRGRGEHRGCRPGLDGLE